MLLGTVKNLLFFTVPLFIDKNMIQIISYIFSFFVKTPILIIYINFHKTVEKVRGLC